MGSSGRATRDGHSWLPADHGYLAWAFDPILAQTVANFGTAGTVYVTRLHLPVDRSVTNVVAHVGTAGVSLTAGQCFAGLFSAASALVGTTADQAAAWATTGVKAMALAGGPFSCAAGDYYGAVFFNGTSLGLSRLGNLAAGLYNAGLAAADSRCASADTGRTTSLPATLGAKTASAHPIWFALS